MCGWSWLSSLLDLKDETLGSVKTIPSIQLKSGRQQSIEYSFLFFPDDASISFFWSSSQSQTVKLFSDPDSEQQILCACIWPVNVINIYISTFMNIPSALFNDQFECNFSASGVQIVRVVIHLFLLRDENMSWIIWIIELRAQAHMMEAWIQWDQITSKLSDLVQIHSHLYCPQLY